jgi:serine/threonine protein kinase/tetratricopeptide (TPR) repeat protein
MGNSACLAAPRDEQVATMMTPDRWQQVKCVLQEALEIAPEQRAAFLDRACSTDHSLRREVESLLSSSNEVRSSFMKSSAEAALRLTKGKRLGDFEIVSLIGAGGMGEVYRARDCRLERDVAIKVLPRFVSFDPERLHRFEHEAKAAAALNHPNILAVFQMGTYEGAPYLVSELLEGETLREQVKQGPIKLKRAIDYGLQIAHGLAAAHEKGIVHRDLKPENLFIARDSQIKILDFGLAKLTHAESETQVTKQTLDTEPGAVLGTVGYMSPEQVRGQAADHRSDIFAFGAILYEMLSGKRAFQGETTADTMSAILSKEPKSISQVVPSISRAVSQVVHHCLEKDPASRYQSAMELISSLEESAMASKAPQWLSVSRRRRWYAMVSTGLAASVLAAISVLGFNLGGWRDRFRLATGSTQIDSLAVLPLENLSKDPSQDYFSDGITDALTTELAQIGALRVISRTSAEHFKGTRETLPEIGRKLNVEAIVEGSVTRSENHVRITAQLIDVQTDRHLWARSYERELKDVLTLQDEVARDIAREIRIKLTPEERTRLAVARPVDPGSHEAYLRGRYWWHRRGRESELKGLQYFEQAVQLDPSYAPAWAGIADSYIVMAHHGGLPPKEAMPKAKDAALKALQLDSSLAEAHASLATVKMSYEWDYIAAENEFARAIELNPNYATAHHWYAHYLVIKQRFPEALIEIQKAHDLDPYSLVINGFWGLALYYSRDYERASIQFRSMLDLDPSERPIVSEKLAEVYEQKGDYAHALEQRRDALMLSRATEDAKSLANAYAHGGAETYWCKRIELAQRPPAASALDLAILYARQGDRDRALRFLERAYQEHSPWLNFMACEPAFDSIRTDPRFQKLAHEIGL